MNVVLELDECQFLYISLVHVLPGMIYLEMAYPNSADILPPDILWEYTDRRIFEEWIHLIGWIIFCLSNSYLINISSIVSPLTWNLSTWGVVCRMKMKNHKIAWNQNNTGFILSKRTPKPSRTNIDKPRDLH